MGATNEIKGTNISLQLDDKKCQQCDQVFTKEEIDDRNFDTGFDTTNDVDLKPMSEVKDSDLYFPSGRTGYQLTIWIRSIEHEDCPVVQVCEGCNEKDRESEMIHEEQRDVYGHKKCLKKGLGTEQFSGQHGRNDQEKQERIELLRKKYPKLGATS